MPSTICSHSQRELVELASEITNEPPLESPTLSKESTDETCLNRFPDDLRGRGRSRPVG